jgi:UDP-glucose 4-epimerase
MQAKNKGHFTIYGADYNTPDGTAIRDYVHVNEICMAIREAIEKPANSLQNLGHGQGHSVKEMVDTFKIVNDCDFVVNYAGRREGDLEKSVLSNPSSYLQHLYTLSDLLKVR